MMLHIVRHYRVEREVGMETMMGPHLPYWAFGLKVLLFQARLEYLALV